MDEVNPYVYADNNPLTNVDPSGLNVTAAFGGLLYETYNWATGNNFNWGGVKGEFWDGYNGPGSFKSPLANITWAAGEDLLNFGTSGYKGVAKNSIQLGIKGANEFLAASKFALPEFASQTQKMSNVIYQGIDVAGDVRYIGITQRVPEARFAEHLNSFETGKKLLQYRVIDGATNLSRSQARVMEQTLINQYGLGKNGGALLNQINSISPKHWERFGIKR